MMENLKSEKNELGKKRSRGRGGTRLGRGKMSQGEGELDTYHLTRAMLTPAQACTVQCKQLT
jgi:hypothetical protein